jgi:hypothetical protein
MAHRLRVPDSTELSDRSTVAELLQAATKPGPTRPIVDLLLRREDQATEQALRFAASGGNPRERAVALQVLGKQGCVDYLDDAKRFLVAQTRQSDRSEQASLRTSYVRYLLSSFGSRRKMNRPRAVRISCAMASIGLVRWTRACSRGSASLADHRGRPCCAPETGPTSEIERQTWLAHRVAAKRSQHGAEPPWSCESPFEERPIGSGRKRTPEDAEPSPTP